MSSATIQVQPVSLGTLEFGSIVSLFDQYMVFYKKPSDPERYQAFLQDRLAGNEATIFAAKNSTGQVTGFTLLYHCFSSTSLGPIVILNDLFVHPSARGSGVGRELIQAVFCYAKEAGAVRVDLGTAKDNHTAQRLYEKLGFVRDEDFYGYSYQVR